MIIYQQWNNSFTEIGDIIHMAIVSLVWTALMIVFTFLPLTHYSEEVDLGVLLIE